MTSAGGDSSEGASQHDGQEPSFAQLRRELDDAHVLLAGIQGSTTFRAAAKASRVAQRLVPPGSRRRLVVRRLLGRRGPGARTAPASALESRRSNLQRLTSRAALDGQAFTVVVWSRPGGDLRRTLASLRAQTWSHWQVALMEPAGADPPARLPVDDSRIRRHRDAAASSAIAGVLGELPEREMVLFLEAGDSLAPDCLYEIAATLRRDPLLDLVTWDDEVASEPRHRRVRLRPAWSPETLLSANYLDRAFALRASSTRTADPAVAGSVAALIWCLLLHCDLADRQVARIARSLSRAARPQGISPRDATAVVGDELGRRGWPARARWDGHAVRVEWTLPSWPRLSVVIPTHHNRDFLGPLLRGLAGSAYADLEVVVVDNGPRTPENEAWYADQPLRPTVIWWDRAFNYSAVNNAGARAATGKVLLFLNDDIEVADDDAWLRELVGWTTVDDVGSVGIQLVAPDGRIQHGGVILGMTGFAGHLFAGLRPGASTLLGPTTWYRDVLAVTAACVLVRRSDFDAVGGFAEDFILCGSDVALGLTLRQRGLRTVCVPSNALTHLESATRGAEVPACDFFASWWRYQRWIRSGDPYFHPRLSLQSAEIRLGKPGEPTAADMAAPYLGRSLTVWHSQNDLAVAGILARRCRIDPAEVAAVRTLHLTSSASAAPRTVNWFIPGIDSPFYGGINTALRIAAKLAGDHGVENRFVVCGGGPEEFIRSGIVAAFPQLASSPVVIAETDEALSRVPDADAAIATLWTTAYQVARHPGARRKFYLVQDFEPMFYPAGTIYALAEESYRLGLYGICNTENLALIYRSYGGTAMHFTPAVDTEVFHASGRVEHGPETPLTLFVYARPGHWRNCWEMAEVALDELKRRLGDRVRILAAGSWSMPDPGDSLPTTAHLGLLDYADTGELYRHCDMGLALTVSEHPSYLPLELMACGAAVVAFDNPAGSWLLRDGDNCLLAPRTVDGLVDRLEAMAVNPTLRHRLAEQAMKDIVERNSDWDAALSGVYAYMTHPERVGAADGLAPAEPAGTHRAHRRAPPPARHA